MHPTNAGQAAPTRPSIWKRLQNKHWSLRTSKSELSLGDRSAQQRPGGIRRMLSSRLGTSQKTPRPWPSSIRSNQPILGIPEETRQSNSPRALSQRTASEVTDSFIRPPNPHIDYDFIPPNCDLREAMSKNRVVVQASEVEDFYSDDGEPSGCEFDRRNFKIIRDISRATLETLVLDLVDPEGQLRLDRCRVTKRDEGSFHHAVFLEIEREDQAVEGYVLKIPAHGILEEWRLNDNMMLGCEAKLLQHIRHHTACPVPEVVAFDGSLRNAIGAPYILMKKMEGIPASDLWLGQPYNTIDNRELHLNADDPSPEVEVKRITFLRSLAQAMSQLAQFEFQYTGVPGYDDPRNRHPKYIGPTWRWHSKMNMEEPTSGGSFETSGAYFAAGLDRVRDFKHENSLDDDGMIAKGVDMVMKIIMSSAPFKPSARPHGGNSPSGHDSQAIPVRETFVLRHDDLDLQNILVDDDGNVTGIIDWDGCAAVPRCVGYSSMPTFLRRDWLPDYGLNRLPHMTWAIGRYREVYTQAMNEFCMSSNAKYTRKSAMYQLVLAALDKDFSCIEVVEMLLRDMSEYRRIAVDLFCRRLGQGWPAAEEALKVKIAELLRPE